MIMSGHTVVLADSRGSRVQGLKTLLLVIAFALAISSCGGGGSGTASSSVDSSGSSSGVPIGSAGSGGSLPLGALVHDGPPTPEQISLFLPVIGPLPQTATATVRYRPTGSSTWTTGHPLFRIRPSFSTVPAVGSVPDAFAWPIIDVTPGTAYDIEVTVTSDAVTDVKTLTHVTRGLPGPAASRNKTVPSGSTSATIQAAFNSLEPGDVLEFQDGTYHVSGLQLNRSGTSSAPIYIRGQSRAGVVLSNANRVLQVLDASDVVIENMTLQGSGVDSGTDASSRGIEFFDGSPTQTRITVRNLTMNGVDKAIVATHEISEFLAYDNTLIGNNTWTTALVDSNLTWNDDGINIPGLGNCAFNNTLAGFGDSLAYAQQSLTQSIGVHFYRNDVRNSGDDFAEVDAAHRNLTLYDNRSHNSATFLSLDPLYGGPLLAARNIVINTARSPFKFNDRNTGQFVYNNTIIRTNAKAGSSHAGWGQAQFNNGPQQAWGYRNNLFVYRGSGNLFAFEAEINNPIDFTHNSWFPDGGVWWTNSGGSFTSLAAAFAGLPPTTPLFSGATKRHQDDNITTSNPWTVAVTLGRDYSTEVMSAYTPVLAAGTAPKNTGVVIPNITDGFSGAAPDRGAIIEGRPLPVYGDRSR
jgi:hypothetical protein